jgi:hypothetical protein
MTFSFFLFFLVSPLSLRDFICVQSPIKYPLAILFVGNPNYLSIVFSFFEICDAYD